MTSARGNVFSADCASRAILETLAEKWSLLILHALIDGPARTSELRRRIGGVSEKMLIQSLRRLERNGFVARASFPQVPPRVEYRLTGIGRSLAATVGALDAWIEENMAAVRAAQHAYDSRPA